MKMLTGATETQGVDIEFDGLTYKVRNGFKSGTKTLLKDISGKFYAGELTAILGPSGSGKTTLLNVLAGYGSKRTSGTIKINNRNREHTKFHKLSAYIMQDVILQPLLTVKEAMVIAAQLKLGSKTSFKEKLVIVEEILTVLGLTICCDTMSERLSGGESKRLSIALELISNPPVIFLDESTSGLDTVAMTQCLETLKVLTKQGRTIVCSIHQPSAAAFKMFDQVYFMADGMCVYNGSPSGTLSFLDFSGLPCPTTYSPAEYVVELVQLNQEHVTTLVDSCQNGKIDNWHQKPISPIKKLDVNNGSELNVYTETSTLFDTACTSFWIQFIVLLRRMMLQQGRNKLALGIQIGHHIGCGLLFGALFYKIGSSATTTQYNFGFSMCVVVFFVFTYIMVPILLFPEEIKLVKREHFNGWYGVNAYYLAVMLRSIPVMFILGLLFLTLCYLMSGQPMEMLRFVSFSAGGLIIAMASEGIGLTVGSIFRVANGAIIGSAIVAPMLILSVYGIGYVYHNIILPVRIAMALSYMRFGASALVVSLLGERQDLECSEIFCQYENVKYFLRIIGMDELSYVSRILPLIGYTFLFKLIVYVALKYRLSPEYSRKSVNDVRDLIRWCK